MTAIQSRDPLQLRVSENALARRQLGGKAATLLELQRAGFPVPAFEVSPRSAEAAIQKFGTPLAVRSSACAEDGCHLSFAGQFRSFLNLNSSDHVRQAIERCYQSVSDPAVDAYCRTHGIDASKLTMQVVVQKMVQPELAGVAFSVNPVTGREEVVIEACAGLADDLLAGRQCALPVDSPLLQQYRNDIECLANRVHAYYGMPQDIEFAVEGGIVYLLQARPITRIGFAGEAGEWTNADFRDGGVSSTVCSPLMWSLYECVWNRSLKETLRELRLFKADFEASRCYFGRPYWNLGAVKDCLATLPGYRECDFDEDLSVQITYEGPGNTTPFSLRNILRALPTLWAVPQFLKRQISDAQHLLAISQEEYLRPFLPVRGKADQSFAELIETRYLPAESTYFRTIFAASLAKLDFLGAFPDADYIGLVSGLPDLRHLAPVRAVQSMTERTPEALSSLIDRFSYHYRLGLDVIQPRWDEDREFAFQLLGAIPARSHASADSAPQQQFEAARDDMLQRLPRRKHRRFSAKLQRLRRLLWLREELRDVSSFLYHRIRQYALAIGQQRELADEVFFQTFQEIISDDRRHIENRRMTYARYRNFAAPNEIGSRFQFDSRIPSGDLQGIAASPGTVTGIAHVCRCVEDAAQMPPGSILVCPCTDPGWTPVLGRAAGVITETGGLLSHAAILCREYGIPAVLGIPHATQRIPDRCQVVLFGSTGHASILSQEGDYS